MKPILDGTVALVTGASSGIGAAAASALAAQGAAVALAARRADRVNISSVAGRVARNGSSVYTLTKHGVGAFSESLRQELAGRHVRVSLVEPGATSTELITHNRPEVMETLRGQLGQQRLNAED